MLKPFMKIDSFLARRMVLYVILVSTSISIFTSGFQIYSEYQRDMNNINSGVNQIETTQLYNITSRIWVLDIEELNITLQGLLSMPSIHYVAVYEGEKILLASGENIKNNFIIKNYPLIYKDGEDSILLGKLVVKASLENVYHQIYERAIIIIIGNIIKTLLVALLILLIFYHLIAKHLVKIAHYTEQLNIDNLNESFSFDRKSKSQIDELDILRNSILRMQKHLVESTTSLRSREKEQSDILDSMLDAVISIDEKGIVLSFNRAAEIMFGYNLDEVFGKNIKLLMPDDIAQKHDEYLHNYHAENISRVVGLGRDVTGMHKNKSFIPLRLFVAKLPRDIQGRQRFIGTLVDLTDFKNQEEQLRRSQKMEALGKLTGGIAHDFNNLLSIVMGYSDLLENLLVDQPELAKYANEIQHAGNRGVELTQKLLSFSRVNSYNATQLNINTLLDNQKDMLKKIIAVRINLEFQFAKDLWLVFLDGSELEDTIINLCINAMHAMQSMQNGAYLQISTSNETFNNHEAKHLNLTPGDYIKISVLDNGTGMNAETKELIFDPFYTTKGAEGTGLGLTQVFGFVKRSKGAIDVKSEQKNGTVFNLYFPRYYTKNIKISETYSNNKKTLGGNESLLVVDDELSLRELTKEILNTQGYNVICADNGKNALKILENHPIDLIISDVIMPEMAGYQLATMVNQLYPHVKLLMVSGYSDKQQFAHIDERFSQNILRKPYEFDTLFYRIRELLDGEFNVNYTVVDYNLIVKENEQILPIIWSDDFSVKLEEMDNDHKEFIALINQCIEVVNDHAKINQLGDILQNLLSHAVQHFHREEKILALNNYRFLNRHKNVHQLYIDYINNYINDFNQQQLSAQTLLDFLVDWLNEHLLGMDKLSSSCFYKDNDTLH